MEVLNLLMCLVGSVMVIVIVSFVRTAVYIHLDTIRNYIKFSIHLGLILEPRRQNMSDDIFEKLLLLKTNNLYLKNIFD